MNGMVGLKDLCSPAYVYLVISIATLLVMMFQNMSNPNKYCLGSYSCETNYTGMIFVIKVLYILFWTWFLNVICRGGATGFAWFLVLLPFILMFITLGVFIINSVPTLHLV